MKTATRSGANRVALAARPIAAGMSMVFALTVGASQASAASEPCRVGDTATGMRFATLQTAVDAASKGARLTVRGTCVGSAVIAKDLTLTGIKTSRGANAKLSGGTRMRVLAIEHGAVVHLRDVEIRGGSSKSGGGILNRGNLTLTDVLVRRNRCRPSQAWRSGVVGAS